MKFAVVFSEIYQIFGENVKTSKLLHNKVIWNHPTRYNYTPTRLLVEFDGDGVGVLVYPLVLELEGLHANVDDSSSKIKLIANDLDRNRDRLSPIIKEVLDLTRNLLKGEQVDGESSNNRGSTNPRWPTWRRDDCGGDGDETMAKENEEGRRRT